MSTATCHTQDCGNEGHPIDVGDLTMTDDETGETFTAGVSCGVCGQPITDVGDAPPEPEPEPEPEPKE